MLVLMNPGRELTAACRTLDPGTSQFPPAYKTLLLQIVYKETSRDVLFPVFPTEGKNTPVVEGLLTPQIACDVVNARVIG